MARNQKRIRSSSSSTEHSQRPASQTEQHPAEQYARDVVSGKVPASKFVIQAAKRHLRDRELAAAGNFHGFWFDEAAAQLVIDFFGLLRHSKGEWGGQKFELQPWQQFIVWVLFGWKRANGTRRFRIAYIEIPRKNGKSTLLAGIGLYLLVADNEPGAEIYTAATKKDQARIIFSEACRMRDRSPELAKHVGKFRDNLHVLATSSLFQPLGADEDTLDGLNVHGGLVDELHAHKKRQVGEVLDTATGARRQSLLVAITTSGFNRQSICWEQHEYSEKVLSGIIEDDSHFAFIACLDQDDDGNYEDWEDERNWAKANPNLGVSVKLDDLRRKANKAKELPTALNAFLRLHLNVWTQADVRAIPPEKWKACSGLSDPNMDPVAARKWLEERLRGRRCIGGLDLADTSDIAAFVQLFPPTEEDPLWWILPHFWIPAACMEKRVKKDRVPYDVWVRQGFITATEGDVTDYASIRLKIQQLGEEYEIAEIAFDRWNATQLTTELAGDGFEMVKFGQGFQSMSGPTRELLKLIIAVQLAHAKNPVLTWMAANLVVKQDPAGNVKPDKQKSTEKIDGIVALVMAIGRVIADPNEPGYYDSGGDLLIV